jgi:hypothetical protein
VERESWTAVSVVAGELVVDTAALISWVLLSQASFKDDAQGALLEGIFYCSS